MASCLPNFLLSGPRGRARSHRGPLSVKCRPKGPENQGATCFRAAFSRMLGCKPSLRPAPDCSQRREPDLAQNVQRRGVSLKTGRTGARRASDRRVPLAANAGSPLSRLASMCLNTRNQDGCRRRGLAGGWLRAVSLAAARLQPTLEQGEAPKRSNPRAESISDGNARGDSGAVGCDYARLMRRSPVTAGRTDCERQARRDSAHVNRPSSY
jgi:hypothetical protein